MLHVPKTFAQHCLCENQIEMKRSLQLHMGFREHLPGERGGVVHSDYQWEKRSPVAYGVGALCFGVDEQRFHDTEEFLHHTRANPVPWFACFAICSPVQQYGREYTKQSWNPTMYCNVQKCTEDNTEFFTGIMQTVCKK